MRKRSKFLQLSSQGRIILRLTGSLEFLLIIRGGIAKARHISTSYKKNLVAPFFDPFVTKLNAQVSCYVSWRPDPDSFQFHGKQYFYACPQFSLISHCLHKIVRVEAEGIMTVSLWPTQPCLVLRLIVDVQRTPPQ